MSTMGQRLRAARELKGLSIGELSRKTAISKGAISLAERDRSDLSASKLGKICVILGIPTDLVILGTLGVKRGEWARAFSAFADCLTNS